MHDATLKARPQSFVGLAVREPREIFWDTLFGPYSSWQEEKALEYTTHRRDDGAHL